MRRGRWIWAGLTMLWAPTALLAQPPALVVDLNAVVDATPDANPTAIARAGAKLIFLACESTRCGLWATDGTTAGTTFLAEPTPGGTPALFDTIEGRTVETGTLAIFMLCSGVGASDCEPWRSDGTPVGTFRLRDIRPGSASSSPAYFTVAGSTVFFAADDGATGVELWKTDGTTAGTVQVEDIVPGAAGSAARHFAAIGATLIFQADKPSETGLWRSDGTAPGTFFYSPVEIRGTEEVGAADPIGPFSAELGGKIIFSGTANPTDGNQLFVTDGTLGGTAHLKGVPGSASSAAPNGFRKLGTRLLFTAFNLNFDDHGVELWATDGTTGGTVELTGLVPGNNPTNPVAEPTVAGSLLYFHNEADSELWKSDGTPGGTQIVEANGGIFPNRISAVGSQVCFRASTAGEGFEIWRSDGTTGGTERLTDLFPGATDGAVGFVSGLGAACLFRGDTAAGGTELWRSGLSAGDAALVREIATVTFPALPRDFIELNGKLLFTADDGIGGRELFASDGTAGGTARVTDLRPGPLGSNPFELARFGTGIVFVADDGLTGNEIFQSNGTAGGTTVLADVVPGSIGSNPDEPTPLGADLYFSADDGSTGRELWRKTPTTLALVADLVNPGSSSPRELTAFLNEIFFLANDAGGNLELWRSNGTTPGTTLVADLTSLSGFTEHGAMRVAAGALRIVLTDTTTLEGAIWSSDGTPGGTAELVELSLGFDNDNPVIPGRITPLGSRFLFRAFDEAESGIEAWGSNGSLAGTVVLNHSSGPGEPAGFATLGGKAYFDGVNENGGSSLWQSDGTLAGTVEVAEVNPFGVAPFGAISTAASRIHFSPLGGEPWASNGTAAGTAALGAPEAQGAGEESGFHVAGRHVFFAADDFAHGVELWAHETPVLFADGFEKGSTAAWSATVP